MHHGPSASRMTQEDDHTEVGDCQIAQPPSAFKEECRDRGGSLGARCPRAAGFKRVFRNTLLPEECRVPRHAREQVVSPVGSIEIAKAFNSIHSLFC
ncbi:MAG TPA: hypothetical protein DDW50_20000, partial [Firmicutes bacterium]|nr:hypothetical protein [Bacillota bacterium]